MPLPPLYKFLDVAGAKLTLGNRTFKHAKPSDFNDTEDLTIQSIFPEDTETVAKKLETSFTDVILRHLEEAPTCASPLKEKVALLQHIYRTNPDAPDLIKAELSKPDTKPLFDVGLMHSRAKAFIKEINDFMQDYRVLCVTTRNDSEAIWAGYAEKHKGIALRIEPNFAKDSKFQLFRPVVYEEKRPPLYDSVPEFIAGSLFGSRELRMKAMLEKIVYSKTLDWAHESEWRLAIPLGQEEQPWNTLPYHPEEITELYVGLGMEEADQKDIIATAQDINPGIAVFHVRRLGEGGLGFNRNG